MACKPPIFGNTTHLFGTATSASIPTTTHLCRLLFLLISLGHDHHRSLCGYLTAPLQSTTSSQSHHICYPCFPHVGHHLVPPSVIDRSIALFLSCWYLFSVVTTQLLLNGCRHLQAPPLNGIPLTTFFR